MSVTTPLEKSPKPNLHILMVEDSPEDFELVLDELSKSGLNLSFKRVETEAELIGELQWHPPDLVFSDHSCAAFDSFAVLDRVRTYAGDVPFILVTGALGEGLLVKALDHGVEDWVSKDRLRELLPAVLRALRLSDERHRMRLLELERDRLRAELAGLRSKQRLEFFLPICASCKKIRDENNEWQSLEDFFLSHHGIRFTHGLCLDCLKDCYRNMGMLPPLDE